MIGQYHLFGDGLFDVCQMLFNETNPNAKVVLLTFLWWVVLVSPLPFLGEEPAFCNALLTCQGTIPRKCLELHGIVGRFEHVYCLYFLFVYFWVCTLF